MNGKIVICLSSLLMLGMLASATGWAQDQRGGGKPGDNTSGGTFGGPDRGFGGRGGGGGRGGFDSGGRGMPGGIEIAKYEALRAYIDVVDRYCKLSQDPQASGVAAVISASDLLRMKGPDPAIQYFIKVLPDVKDSTVQRAIHIQLADLYKQAGQTDKALEQYELLMKGTLAAPAPTPAPSRSGQ